MIFEASQIQEAYIKLKSYIYYDNTDILLRRQLVEFETNKTKEFDSMFKRGPKPYKFPKDAYKLSTEEIVSHKLERLTSELNNYNSNPEFINFFLDQISTRFYPKKIKEQAHQSNFITNKRVESSYEIERVTAFIDAPIELHILSVLWILQIGVHLDAGLSSSCLGNRLLLNKERKDVVKGSGLFKPYYKQYQKWRDDSVQVAKELLEKDKNVLFLNLDIKDYFHSIRLPITEIFEGRKQELEAISPYNLQDIFLKIHLRYTEIVAKEHQVPLNFYSELKGFDTGNLQEVILPIGLISSYVLGNNYLKEFDKRMTERMKPAYYGRYVDDILVVLSEPNPNYNLEEKNEEIGFSFSEYSKGVNENEDPNEKISFNEKNLSELERYTLINFYPVIKLIDVPELRNLAVGNLGKEENSKEKEKIFKVCGYPSLFFQAEKSLIYYFDHEESDLVIDKLKRELDERTSEFRDFPDEESNNSFEESAYHLLYDGTEGKIKTLKDYKENRYGLTIYLTNKIFSALRHERKISEEEKDQVLKLFRGSNCLNFYRLWERIFTFFLVNGHSKAYVDFYLHCAEQIENLRAENLYVSGTKVDSRKVQSTLVNYLDCAHELVLSLNPSFIIKTQEASKHFEFKINSFKGSSFIFFSSDFEPTKKNSFWVRRFRETNMIRHQYVVQPLLNYTESAKAGWIDLTTLKFDFNKLKIDDELKKSSPRPVKFWECCLAVANEKLSEFDVEKEKRQGDHILTRLFGIGDKKKISALEDIQDIVDGNTGFYLEEAFELFKELNKNHIPASLLGEKAFREQFFTINPDGLEFDEWPELKVLEITVNSYQTNKLKEPRIAFANTKVEESSILKSLRGDPNLSIERYRRLAGILKKARKENADILLFPKSFIPINLLSSIVRYSEKNQILTVTGLEHLSVGGAAFNFIITILPVEVNGVKDAVVVFRLKNHYSHSEEQLIQGNYLQVPKPKPYRYDIFNWRNIYFSPYYCFELSNSAHRSLFKGKIDLLVGVEWNRDTPYFSNIVEAVSRDLHVYVAQVNTSQFGDTRLTQPVESARKDIKWTPSLEQLSLNFN